MRDSQGKPEHVTPAHVNGESSQPTGPGKKYKPDQLGGLRRFAVAIIHVRDLRDSARRHEGGPGARIPAKRASLHRLASGRGIPRYFDRSSRDTHDHVI